MSFMIDNVYLYNYTIKSNAFLKAEASAISETNSPLFTLKTCQRLLILSYGQLSHHQLPRGDKRASKPVCLKGADAYQYMLEVLCGLQSQLLGENEIVNQFKTAMCSYSQSKYRHKNITIVLEKLLQDTKEIRTQFLSHVGQSSYASVTKKILGKSSHKEILIIGTGHLAQDLLHYFKKTHKITICARNKSKLDEWQNIAPFKMIPWLDLKKLQKFPIILNTVGVPNFTLADATFFHEWNQVHSDKERFFIDFGSPSSIEVPKIRHNIFTLPDLFAQGNQFDLEKLTKVEQAKRGIEQTALKRVLWLDQKMQRDQNFISLSNQVNSQASFNY